MPTRCVAPLPPTRHPAAGQSSLEYVGLVTLVAAALAAAGPAAGSSGVGAAVARVMRTGVCIVAGDVCRPADAEAAGLAPCTVSDRRRGASGALTILSVRFGERREWTVAKRSDGSVVVMRDEGDEVGVEGGLGFEGGAIRVGVDGILSMTVAHGTAWELPDAATAARFFADLRSGEDLGRWRPTWRSGDAGLATNGWAGLGVALGRGGSVSGQVGGIETTAESALGARVSRGATTLYLRVQGTPPQLVDPAGRAPGAPPPGPALVEYTRDRNGPRELAFRATTPGPREDEVVETVARLDLRVPANRAVAARLLRARAPWPPSVAADLRAVIRHTVAVGTVERNTYAVHDRSADLSLAGRLGLEVGVDVGRIAVDRRLVAASAWTNGSPERAREDCIV